MSNTSKSAAPPKHLSKEAQARWQRLAAEYEINAAVHDTLELGLEAFDRMRQAQAELRKAKSLFVTDRNGICRAHPAIAVERTSRAAMLAAYKLIGFDVAEVDDNEG